MSTKGVSYYECHVTMTGDRAMLEATVNDLGWKFSSIEGDVNLGDGIKYYATKQFNKKFQVAYVQDNLFAVAATLSEIGTVLRRKIELVIFDDRSSKVQCNGGCIECHLDDLI